MSREKAGVPVSILVPIKNESANLSRCLKSVSWADEIIVVDSHSSDDSASIAESYGARVVQFSYVPPWPKKKNWALDNLTFQNPWVFILDADEELPFGAEEEIGYIVSEAGDENKPAGYWVNRKFMFMGKWLKHAYYPNWNLRLFRHELGRYERLSVEETQSGDNEVHEHVIIDGPTGHLKLEMMHYAFPSVEVFVEKHNRYSNWEARISLAGGFHGKTGISDQGVAIKRRLKRLFLRLPGRPFMRFAYVYLWQKGFLDGREGFYFACLHGFYELLTEAKTYELKRSRSNQGSRTS